MRRLILLALLGSGTFLLGFESCGSGTLTFDPPVAEDPDGGDDGTAPDEDCWDEAGSPSDDCDADGDPDQTDPDDPTDDDIV